MGLNTLRQLGSCWLSNLLTRGLNFFRNKLFGLFFCLFVYRLRKWSFGHLYNRFGDSDRSGFTFAFALVFQTQSISQLVHYLPFEWIQSGETQCCFRALVLEFNKLVIKFFFAPLVCWGLQHKWFVLGLILLGLIFFLWLLDLFFFFLSLLFPFMAISLANLIISQVVESTSALAIRFKVVNQTLKELILAHCAWVTN